MKKIPIPKDINLWQEYTKTIPKNPVRKKSTIQRVEVYPNVIDLHGFTLDEGYRALKIFMQKNFEQKSKSVIIITGQSTNLQSFKNKVPRWLLELPFSNYVSSITPAPLAQGGAGALIIKLKTSNIKNR